MCDNHCPCPRIAKRHLRKARIPWRMRREVSYRPAGRLVGARTIEYPPDPGCTYPPLGSVRIWGAFNLADWFRHAPKAFGPPHTTEEIAELCYLAAQLRDTEPSGKALWALDVLHPHRHWTDHPRIALGISELVYYGPQLPADLVEHHSAAFSRLGWRLASDEVNAPRTDSGGLPCYETIWTHGS